MIRLPVAILSARRRFAWRPVTLQNGRRVWLRWVFQLLPVCGLRPMLGGRFVTHVDQLPHMRPGPVGWLAANTPGKAWRMRHRFALYLVLWFVVVCWIGQVIGWLFHWPPAFGGLRLGEWVLYWPGQFLTWADLLAPGDRWLVWTGGALAVVALLAVLARIALDLFGRYRPRRRVGADRWAGQAELRLADLLQRRRR